MPTPPRITFISAGAGSGKTYRLTEILHQELLSGDVDPAGIIATTFTRKAAAELRERVRGHLLKQGNTGLATAMGLARIGTVNSLCGQLLERFAFEAGMPPQQRVLEDSQAKVLLNQAIDRVLNGEMLESFLAVARRMGLEINEQTGEFKTHNWLDDLRQILGQLRTNDIDLESAKGFAKRNADELLAHFPAPTSSDLKDELLSSIPDVLAQLIAADSYIGTTRTYISLLKDFQRSLGQDSARWSDWAKLSKTEPEKKLKPLVERIGETAARFAESRALHNDIQGYLEQVFSLAISVVKVYGDSKRELGVLDFADQEHALLKLLDNPAVSQVLGEELDLVMVDEFQDTSPMQLAIFLKLSQLAKRVYWVGDIKQAIYGFRGSDSALMQAILESLPQLGGQKEVLTQSWRSRPELVELVNDVFAPAFEPDLAAPEVRLSPTRQDRLPGPAFANWSLDGSNVVQHMEALAAGIQQLIDQGHPVFDNVSKSIRNVRPGDITVLCYSNSNVTKVASALAQAGLHCSTAQPGLLASAEATLALACLRRLNDPADTLATAQIVSLTGTEEPEAWVSERLRYLAAEHPQAQWREHNIEDHAAHPVVAAIALLRADLALITPKEALQRLIAECDLLSLVTAWSSSPALAQQRLANLDALIDLAQQHEELCRNGLGAASISGMILWLDEIAKSQSDALPVPALDAVQVMTHHASKGLEWPVVILMDLARDFGDRLWSVSTRSNSIFDPHRPLHDRFIRYWPWPLGKQQKVPIAEKIADSEAGIMCKHEATEEAKRLLYVSMTRARDLLVIASPARNMSGPWLNCVNAPWLILPEGEQQLRLPGGSTLLANAQKLSPRSSPIPVDVSVETLHWFAPNPASKPRLPLIFRPSSSETRTFSTHRDKCQIGARIVLQGSPEMSVLGAAIHASLCLSFADKDQPAYFAHRDRSFR
ncbi:DNA helicase UvrD [Pseudomonas fluorescens HK44]|uniref:DNA 3'-5' helicase n=1 Tax=Pseudomonas fluorescens HK44 TaxID=1042209 RepID=A0A010T5B1_PSEFL|nr:UvrD-helicase domain-containing protein [Pseudomonas fluorescens]EXF92692.1 DNA helicase UvrD [Pseudomonas fluorescens HK44]